MTVEDAIAAAVAARIVPEIRAAVRAEVAELARRLPAQLGTIEEAAKLLEVSTRTIRRNIKAGSIPYRKVGRSVRVDLDALRPLSSDDIAAAARATRSEP
jgi:excisionase family DNA binding protein